MRIKNSIFALIKLMTDPDRQVTDHALSTLLSYGEEIIPDLKCIEDNYIDSPDLNEKVSIVLKEIYFQRTKRLLYNWLNSSDKNLLEATYIVCTYQYPDLEYEDFVKQLQVIKHRCWIGISVRQTSFEKVELFNKIFFEEFKFVFVNDAVSSPFEILVNSVLETREGTDFSIGLIYSLVAQSLDLPIYGVVSVNKRIPFVLAYLDEDNLLPILNWEVYNNGVLFYIEIEKNGLVVNPEQLKDNYKIYNWPLDKVVFEPSSNTVLIQNYLKSIQFSFANHPHYRYKMQDIDDLLELF